MPLCLGYHPFRLGHATLSGDSPIAFFALTMFIVRRASVVLFSIIIWATAAPALAGSGVLVARVLDDSTGEHLPARVYVTGSDRKPRFVTPEPGRAIARYDRVNEDNGTREAYTCIDAHPVRVEVPAGRCVVTIERGKEYEPLTRRIAIAEGQTAEETFRLRRLFSMAAKGWYSGEMHVHGKLGELAARQLAEDLNVTFPITAWSYSDREVPEAKEGGRVPDKGELVRIDDTHVYWNLNTEYELDESRQNAPLGGFLVLGHTTPFKLTMPPITPLIEEARRQGGFLDLDIHTWPWSMMVIPVARIDTFPLCNCHMWRLKPRYLMWGEGPPAWMNAPASAAGWVEYTLQTWYALLNSGFVLAPSAGTANGVHPVPLGYDRVYVKLDGPFSYEKWLEGLRKGRSFATNGPVLFLDVEGMGPGDRRSLAAGRDVTMTVTVEARSVGQIDRVELVINGRVVPLSSEHLQPGASEHLRRFRTPVTVTGTSWIAARCYEKTPPDNVRFAHTAPVFLDDPSRPLLPERRQIDWLIDRVQSQIDRVRGKLPDSAMAEYDQALRAYRAVKSRLPGGAH